MSLIDRLRQLVGPADPTQDGGAGRQAAGEKPWSGVQGTLDGARDALAELSGLAGEQSEIDNQVRYWNERVKLSERLVERETTGSRELVHASDLAADASLRLAELETFQRILVEGLAAAEPSSDAAREILAGVREYQNRAAAVTASVSPEEAALQAAALYLGQLDASGRTALERLQEARAAIVREITRVESLRPGS